MLTEEEPRLGKSGKSKEGKHREQHATKEK
jgi:hypothetical protein